MFSLGFTDWDSWKKICFVKSCIKMETIPRPGSVRVIGMDKCFLVVPIKGPQQSQTETTTAQEDANMADSQVSHR